MAKKSALPSGGHRTRDAGRGCDRRRMHGSFMKRATVPNQAAFATQKSRVPKPPERRRARGNQPALLRSQTQHILLTVRTCIVLSIAAFASPSLAIAGRTPGHAPESIGGTHAATDPDNNGPANASHIGDPKFDTADFNDIAPGNLRVDYVLPSSRIEIVGAEVFWPAEGDPDRALVGEFGAPDLFSGFPTSDHRAVFVDTVLPPGENVSAAPSAPPQP